MLEIKHTEVFGLFRAIKASGNAMTVGEINTEDTETIERVTAGHEEDYEKNTSRAKKLGSAKVGSGHDHYLLGVHVQFDIKYPQYWTIEAERYHNFEIITSQGKMHRLTTMGKDENFGKMFNKYVSDSVINIVKLYIEQFNSLSEYKEIDGVFAHPTDSQAPVFRSKEVFENQKYETFMRCVSNLPHGFEMWMACDLTYLQLKTMYFQRRNHKLKEDWGAFCDWCESLPMFKELIGIKETSNE
jgi:hypothetical protein